MSDQIMFLKPSAKKVNSLDEMKEIVAHLEEAGVCEGEVYFKADGAIFYGFYGFTEDDLEVLDECCEDYVYAVVEHNLDARVVRRVKGVTKMDNRYDKIEFLLYALSGVFHYGDIRGAFDSENMEAASSFANTLLSKFSWGIR